MIIYLLYKNSCLYETDRKLLFTGNIPRGAGRDVNSDQRGCYAETG